MSSTSQSQIMQQNTKLLRKSVLMPQQTKFESLKRLLEGFVKNGVSLFNKWRQPYEPVPPLQAPETSTHEAPRSHLKYNFAHFAETLPPEMQEHVETKYGVDQPEKLQESMNEDLQSSRAAIEEQSFEARFKKGAKRVKRDESESSFQREPRKKAPLLSREESKLFEAANFSVFLEMQKNIGEAKKRCRDRVEEESNSKCAEYLKYALKVGSLATQSQLHSGSNFDSIKTSQSRRQPKNLRKKVLFEDESHQLYDLSKVYESLDAEKMRRQQQRQLIAENKRREEEERRAMLERAELQRKLQAERREQQAARQNEQQEKERKLAEEQLLQDQQDQQIQASKQLPDPAEAEVNMDSAQGSEKKEEAVLEQPKHSNDIQQLPQTITEPEKKPSEQKKSELLIGTPKKESPQQLQSQTPLKANNPFFNPPAKTLKMQDLINNHKPASSDNPIFAGIGAVASPARSNIFSAPNPVNNPFTAGPLITSPSNMTPNTLPIPILKQPPQPPPPTIFAPFHNSIMNNSPNNTFPPTNTLPSFFPPTAASPFSGMQAQGLGFNSSGSSSGGMVPQPSFAPFPSMGTGSSFGSKNLFIDQQAPEESTIFGGSKPSSGGSTSSKPAGSAKGKKLPIRIS